MDPETFRRHAHTVVDRMADYLANIETFPVRSQVRPGELLRALPGAAPEHGEPFEDLLGDFDRMILPGITHWQHPMFQAYFPANSSPPSVLAEMLVATLGAQCMLWETSPAAAELEQRCLEWLRDLLGLPSAWDGVIQDTASSATLVALLCARERATDWSTNHAGLFGAPRMAVYASTETHSSLDKAVRIAGIGSDQLRKVAVDSGYAMDPDALRAAIRADRAAGILPLCVVATLGTTNSTAVDPLAAIGAVCAEEGVWLHVDAAYAGSAFLLPELRHHLEGIEHVDSFVFNPHKWLAVNFDCSAYYVKDRGTLIRTFEILPEYLKTGQDAVVRNYRDWGIALGRRFRALKLWFVLRSYGAEGLRTLLRNHIAWAGELRGWIEADPGYEVLAPSPFALVCFRAVRPGLSEDALDTLNTRLVERINDGGRLYVTKTKLAGRVAVRMSVGATSTTRDHVAAAWDIVRATAAELPAD